MPASDTKDITLYRGILKIDRHDLTTGAKTGFVDIGEADQFEYQEPEITEVELFTSRNKSGGKAKGFIARIVPKFRIRFYEMNAFNVALGTLGIEATLSQTTASITDENITSAPKKGRHYYLTKRGTVAAPLTAFTITQAAVTLVLGTDYTVDAVRGEIFILPTSPAVIENTTPLLVDYTYPTISLKKVAPWAQPTIYASLSYTGDSATGVRTDVDVWRTQIKPADVRRMLNPPTDTEFTNLTIQGDVLDDTAGLYGGSAAEPFAREVIVGQVS